MTRFARVHGANKPSFNKVAEDATPWEVLKQPVEEGSNDEEESEDEKEVENKVVVLKETTCTPVNTVWCEFENPPEKNEDRKHIQDNLQEGKSKKKGKELKKKRKCSNDNTKNISCNSEIDCTKSKKRKKSCKIESEINQHTEIDKIATDEPLNEKTDKPAQSSDGDEGSKPYKRRKPDEGNKTVLVNGEEVKVTRFEGFYVTEDDAVMLRKMKKKLKSNNVPTEKINFLVKKGRQKAEKVLSRIKKKLCLSCRQYGHNLSTCPNLTANGICYKCGSTEHSLFQCKATWSELKFATCFICKEQGHLSKNCPDNPRGMYPNGGGCRLCGDVTHLKQDCPKSLHKNNKIKKVVAVNTFKKGKFSMDEDFEDNPTHRKFNSKKNNSTPKPKKIIFK